MNDPLITLYITNYNYAEFIEKAIDSALQQTFQNFEIIIIDDGSTDESRSLITAYQDLPKVRIIFQKNKGLNATINVAIKAAHGEFIMRLDADDYLDENALMVMYQRISRDDDVAMVFPDYYYVDQEGNITGIERRHNFETDVHLLDKPAHGACCLIRKNALIEAGAYSSKYTCQDGYDLWLKFIKNYKVRNVQLPLFFYRRHKSNLTNDNERILQTRAQILSDHVGQRALKPLNVVAVLPVRGQKVDPNCLSMSTLGNKLLIEWTIDEVLEASKIQELIVTSPDEKLLDHVKSKYGVKVTTCLRDIIDARENVSYANALKQALEYKKMTSAPDAVLGVTIDAPFRTAMYINKTVHAMQIYDVDVVIGVTVESNQYFRDFGRGLEVIGNNDGSYLRLERDYLYRQSGGLSLIKLEKLMAGKDPYNGNLGHIILSKKAGYTVLDELDLIMANALLSN